MNATATIPTPDALRERGTASHVGAVAGVLLAIAAVAASATLSPRWLAAIGVALSLFFALKLATLGGHWRTGSAARILAYLALWPGMNAATFLRKTTPAPARPTWHELLFAFGKVGVGLALAGFAIAHAFAAATWTTGVAGITGMVFTFHFGVFHVLSWAWRRAGIAAPLLMRAPIAATSLAEFWSVRWNTAFSELARRFVLRPLARRWGARGAGLVVFFASGVVHEVAISLPARGGWGGPMLYFLLQAAGLAAERSAAGRRCGLGGGVRGWLWTALFTLAPVPLLFHAPLLERVVVPLLRFLKEVL